MTSVELPHDDDDMWRPWFDQSNKIMTFSSQLEEQLTFKKPQSLPTKRKRGQLFNSKLSPIQEKPNHKILETKWPRKILPKPIKSKLTDQFAVNPTFGEMVFYKSLKQFVFANNPIDPIANRIQTAINGQWKTCVIDLNSDVVNLMRYQQHHVILIRIASKELPDDREDYIDCQPRNLTIVVGTVDNCNLTPNAMYKDGGKRPAPPVDITSACLEVAAKSGNVRVMVGWSPEKVSTTFIVSIVFAREKSIMSIIEQTPRLSSRMSRKNLKEWISDGDDGQMMLSLLCSYTGHRMNFPGRGTNCDHLQCFDIGQYLVEQRKTWNWLCPLCAKPTTVNELDIDNFIIEIISHKSSINANAVRLNAYGDWIPIINN